MKVTIDSTEPLSDALRVIGALYEVTLDVVDETAAAQARGADGPAPAPDGSAPAPDGSAPAPDGSAPAPQGSAPAAEGSAPAMRKVSRKPTATTPRQRSQRPTARRKTGADAPVSVSEIRSWAQANGHLVKSRGTLPAFVRAAYADAHGG
ncbi:Lsr2 family DNA-binding protein [Pedococcus sp. 5OH_020]|uniref:Lsr2 family DNA-binding protein n=1 Tax=Pedococcus sp. 5OH_020 TaxID=2989814 RepID=UPI0022E9AF4B|nr:histone-like nucleoid-structuring protein Lsr2 [Pedococcus sp. 5OH_020]